MNYLQVIESEVEVPAIWMKDVRKRCYDVIRSNSSNNKGYIKSNYDYMLRLKQHCKNRGSDIPMHEYISISIKDNCRLADTRSYYDILCQRI